MTFTTKRVKRAVALVAVAAITAMAAAGTRATTTVYGAPDGAATFKAKCAGCHGQDGSGNTPAGKGLKVKDLRSAEVQGLSDAQLFDIIAKGKGKMPAYEKTLGADACKELVAFVRKLKG